MIKIQDLVLKNPWWSENHFVAEESNWIKRELYDDIEANLKHSLMLNIVGLRRVGKSTILKQIISQLLLEKKNPKNIFYFLFDYSSRIQKSEFLDEVLSLYCKDILNNPELSFEDQVYVFLDEIQYIEDWQSVLKKFYDLSGKKIKFIVTGSQSVLLKGKHSESLAGRIFDFYLPPLSFREFLVIHKEKIKIFERFDLFVLPRKFGELGMYDSHFGRDIARLSREYVTVGQFPETRSIQDIEKKHEYISESVIGKVLDDCVRVFKIEKTDEFKLIAYQLINNVSSIFELKNIGREVGVSFLTLEKYIEYLKEAYIVEVLYKCHKSLIRRGRILKKIYTPCINFVCALNHYNSDHIDEVPQAFGKIIENAMYNVLNQKYKGNKINNALSFWRHGEKEIDFLVHIGNDQLPIEVKFSNTATVKDAIFLADYVKQHSLQFGIVVTKNELDRKEINGKTIYYIPYYLILLMV
jgi:hypothetical protein